ILVEVARRNRGHRAVRLGEGRGLVVAAGPAAGGERDQESEGGRKDPPRDGEGDQAKRGGGGPEPRTRPPPPHAARAVPLPVNGEDLRPPSPHLPPRLFRR